MQTTTVTPTSAAPQGTWRDRYPVHPCANVFPMMNDEELDALAADIKAHGLQQPVRLWPEATPETATKTKTKYFVLDGRNRLEALIRLGVEIPDDPINDEAVLDDRMVRIFATHWETADAAAYVIGANIRRRHLTKEQQAELIVRTLEAGQTIDAAKMAESKNGRAFNPTVGKKGGSTKDIVLTAAVEEGKKHDISKRTIQRARAKAQGKTPAPPKPTPTPAAATASAPAADEPRAIPQKPPDQSKARRTPRNQKAKVDHAMGDFARWSLEQITEALESFDSELTETLTLIRQGHDDLTDAELVDADRPALAAALRDARDRIGQLYDELDEAQDALTRTARGASIGA